MVHPPLETFQIGWIYALPIEAAAATVRVENRFPSGHTSIVARPVPETTLVRIRKGRK